MSEFGADSVEALLAEDARAQELRSRDEYEPAIALTTHVLERLEGLVEPRSPEILGVRSRFAHTLMRAGRHREAEEQLREVQEAWTLLRGPGRPTGLRHSAQKGRCADCARPF